MKSEYWRLDDEPYRKPELIVCVICHETYDVHNTSDHVRRHRRSEMNLPQVPYTKIGYDSVREPQFRPIVEPEEYVIKPERNVYVVEKIPRGGRSSFQTSGLVGSGEITIPLAAAPTVSVTPASVVRPKVEEVTEVVEVIDNIPPSQIAPMSSEGGVMIGGTGHNRLYNQLALGEPTTTVTSTIVQEPNGRVTQIEETVEEVRLPSRMNPHAVVIDPLPQPVIVEEHVAEEHAIPPHTILDNQGIAPMPTTYLNTSQRSQTIIDQQSQFPQPQYVEPLPNVIMPEQQSTHIVIQQGDALRGNRVIITQDAPAPHVNLFNQPTSNELLQ